MRRSANVIHAGFGWLLVIAILVQVFLAGSAILNLGGSGNFGDHVEFGYTWVGLAALAVLLSGIAARPGRDQIVLVTAVFIDYIVQTILPSLQATASGLAALHPVNAMILFVLAVVVSWRATARVMSAGADVGQADQS